jgi:predicted ArsR family transcriptional regulator
VRIQRIQFLEKYAARAEDLLSQKYGGKYTSEDVEKLAEALINMDVKRAAEFERVEEIVKQAHCIARSFAVEIDSRLGRDALQKIAALKTSSIFESIRKAVKGKERLTKIVNKVEKGGRRFHEFVKKDPYMAAGIGAGGLGIGVAGSAFLTDNE